MPPSHRTIEAVRPISRILLTKAARRLRRDGWSASQLNLFIMSWDNRWNFRGDMPALCDDTGILNMLEQLWALAEQKLPHGVVIARIGVDLGELCRTENRQLDLLFNDETKRKRLEAVTTAIDNINRKNGATVVSVGPWSPPAGNDHIGAKISYTRIPRAEDFY